MGKPLGESRLRYQGITVLIIERGPEVVSSPGPTSHPASSWLETASSWVNASTKWSTALGLAPPRVRGHAGDLLGA
ncbi:MAG: hypothetical protein AB7W28_02485 [Armatimonadota bacterium]